MESGGEFRARADMTFLEELISCLYTNFCLDYQWAIGYMGAANFALAEMCRCMIYESFSHEEKQRWISTIEDCLKQLWEHHLFDYFDPMDENHDFPISRQMEEKCKKCYQMFCGENADLPVWTRADTIRSALKAYRDMIHQLRKEETEPSFPLNCSALIMASFACILWEQYRQSCEIVYHQFKSFCSFLQSRQGDSGLSDSTK